MYGTSQYGKKIPAKVARELMLAEEETEILEVAVILPMQPASAGQHQRIKRPASSRIFLHRMMVDSRLRRTSAVSKFYCCLSPAVHGIPQN